MARGLAALVALGIAVVAAHALANPLAPFVGEWRGVAVEVQAHGDLQPSDLDLAVTRDGDGFRLTWTAFEFTTGDELLREQFSARFAPTKRKGVYAFDDRQGSILGRLFASPATGNPLKGEVLLWGRVTDEELVIYGLSLEDQGDFELQQVAITRDGEALAMERSLRTGSERVTMIAGLLQPVGN